MTRSTSPSAIQPLTSTTWEAERRSRKTGWIDIADPPRWCLAYRLGLALVTREPRRGVEIGAVDLERALLAEGAGAGEMWRSDLLNACFIGLPQLVAGPVGTDQAASILNDPTRYVQTTASPRVVLTGFGSETTVVGVGRAETGIVNPEFSWAW